MGETSDWEPVGGVAPFFAPFPLRIAAAYAVWHKLIKPINVSYRQWRIQGACLPPLAASQYNAH